MGGAVTVCWPPSGEFRSPLRCRPVGSHRAGRAAACLRRQRGSRRCRGIERGALGQCPIRYGEPGRRHVMGRVFNALTRRLVQLPPECADTQCGFKCFRANAARGTVRQRSTMNGFSYDVEVLHLAHRSRDDDWPKLAVDWHYREHSKVRPLRDALSMTMDLLRIRVAAPELLRAIKSAVGSIANRW